MILIGASGHAKVIIDILEKNDEAVEYLLDANPNIKELAGYEVITDTGHNYALDKQYIISIGANSIRQKIAGLHNLTYGWAIHPSAILGDDVSIGQGTVIMAGAVINSSTQIGNHAIINTSASVDHDCKIGDYVHISPNATLCGTVEVGEGTQVGAGATIIPNLKIGKWATIGAGAVIISNVPDHAVVVGNPGRVIRLNNGEE
ncbi:MULTISPECIES: acetyltransferase [Roseivirga]|uniref:Acetyltransferase n=1 Tax=Roseivirga thermotolerans TaxID=1758176 RepID=A0ABQ3IC67_9BACT|nr:MULTISPECIES: acetyltransferase [Roseivirga]GHE68740.1 acetyltransferase [Roseivirga thermotolerans]|tara:strand:+ start:9072 stop:9680 length:609 start_codon:yes stop_codon:yes gene_type:complete